MHNLSLIVGGGEWWGGLGEDMKIWSGREWRWPALGKLDSIVSSTWMVIGLKNLSHVQFSTTTQTPSGSHSGFHGFEARAPRSSSLPIRHQRCQHKFAVSCPLARTRSHLSLSPPSPNQSVYGFAVRQMFNPHFFALCHPKLRCIACLCCSIRQHGATFIRHK